MPVEHTTEPQLSIVIGRAYKETSVGTITLDLRIEGDQAMGYPPDAEMDAILLGLFNAVGYEGWRGSISKQYVSSTTYSPNPPRAE